MAEGFKDFAAGDVLGAADLDDYCVRQSVMVFADATARDAALTSGIRREGMVVANKALDRLEVYNGSSWLSLVPFGGWTTWSPTWTQAATITHTVTRATYARIGSTVIALAELVATGAGTASNAITIGNLPLTAADANAIVGTFDFFDLGSTRFTGMAQGSTTTAMTFRAGGQSDTLGVTAPTVASGDTLTFFVIYEAA